MLLLGVVWLLMFLFGGAYYNLIELAATRAIAARGSADEPAAMADYDKARLAWHPMAMTAVGFLGLGAIPPDVEWGAMLVDSIRYLFQGSWWALMFPGFAIMLTVIGFNLIGDGMRDSLDVRIRG